MTTVSQIFRKNLEAAKAAVEGFGFEPGSIKVKAIGGGEYRCWCASGDFDQTISSETAFDGGLMEDFIRGFMESFGSLEPDLEDEKARDGYGHVVGGDNRRLTRDSIHEIDCRMDNWDDAELDSFWAFDATEFIPEQLEEIFAEKPLMVFHRKGKEWAVSPVTDAIGVEIYYLDEEDREECYWCEFEGEFTHNVTDEMRESADEAKRFIEGCKDDLEMRCLSWNFIKKLESINPFLIKEVDEDEARDLTFEWIYSYYRENPSRSCFDGFHGAFRSVDSSTDFKSYMSEFDMFKHQDMLAVKDHMKLYKLEKKLGFEADFDYSESERIALNFQVEGYSVHVTAEEFSDCNENWTEVLRDVVFPQVARRRAIDAERSLKAKIGKDIKSYAMKVWVRFQDSLEAGNCRFGSEAFCQRHSIDTEKLGAIRGDALLDLENNDFTKRIIFSLVAQHPELVQGGV